MGRKSISGDLAYYSKVSLSKKLGTVSLIKLMKLAYEEDNRVAIGCYFFYNPNARLNNYLFRELKGSTIEFEKNYSKKGTPHYKYNEELIKRSNSSETLLEKKMELINEIKTFIKFYEINLSYFCKENHLPYQVIYRTVIKGEHHKMSFEKLENVRDIMNREFHH